MPEIKKKCALCRLEKPESDFYVRKDIKGHDCYCKKCRKIKSFRWYRKNSVHAKEYKHKKYCENREERQAQYRIYYKKNAVEINRKRKERREVKKHDVPTI